MRRFGAIATILVTFLVLLAVAQASTTSSVTGAQLTASFKKSTGDKLLVNKKASYPGHFRAYDVGVQTIAKKGKYGTFTVYLVTGADVAYEVNDLLADGHTGQLGTPGPGKIYWEQGASAFGDKYWLAKKQYGENVVLWWFTSSAVKKTDKTFKRLHTTLTNATK